MKCRAAHRLISAERDGAISSGERTVLEAHVAGCVECRQAREALAAAAAAWKAADASATTLDVEHAWHAIRREIRASGGATARDGRAGVSWIVRASWAAVPVAAAAAIALVVWTRGPGPITPGTSTPIESWTQFVEVDQSAAAPVVFVDQESGWIVVWAAESVDAQS